MKLYTSKEAVEYLLRKPHKNAEFKNVKDEDIEIFLCNDGTVGIGIIGDGEVIPFNRNDYINDLWIMSLNPYK